MSREELVVEREDDAFSDAEDEIESRVDRFVEVERELRDELEEVNKGDVDSRVDLRPGITANVRKGTVVDVEKVERQFRGKKLVLTVRVEDDEYEYEINWPRDPTDPSEPLNRVCQSDEVPVDRFANLNEVPVIRDGDGEWNLYIPPSGVTTRSVEFVLPTGREMKGNIPSIGGLLQRAWAPVVFAAVMMRVASPDPVLGVTVHRFEELLVAMLPVMFLVTAGLVTVIPSFPITIFLPIYLGMILALLGVEFFSGDVETPK